MIGRETRERILQTCKVHGSDSNINIAAFHLLCDGLVELGRAEGRSEARKTMMQLFTDPENQPSQYGTVTLEYMEREIEAERKEVNRLKDLCQEMLKELYVYRGCEYLKDVTASMREMAQKAGGEK